MRTLISLVLLVGCQTGPSGTDDKAEDTDTYVPSEDDPSLVAIEPYDPLPLVDVFAATGGDGAEVAGLNPGAIVPTGMVHLGPDTRRETIELNFYHFGGYWYGDDRIRDFSHTHAHGMGVNDFGTVPVMIRDGWDDSYTRPMGRQAAFSHDREVGSPGYYQVDLLDDASTVELTATLHGGQIRVTFPADAEPVVIFDLGTALPTVDILEAWAEWTPGEARFEGFQRAGGGYSDRFGGLMTHFAATADPAPISGGVWTDPDAPTAVAAGEGLQRVEGVTSGFWLTFPKGTTMVELRTALSYVDHDGAWANHKAELEGKSFDDNRALAEDAWRERMSAVRVRGGRDEQQRVFHTALYNSLKFPTRMDDVDGQYRGLDQGIHTTDHPYYSNFSMWDTFRTAHPWYTLAWPELQTNFLRSLVRMVKDGGSLPMWPMAHGYTGGMVGSPGIQILAEAWLKGLRDFDEVAAYEAALQVATGPVPRAGRSGLDDYKTIGYVPVEASGGSVSDTLEYAWNDHALALWGEALGRPEAEVEEAWTQSRTWKNLFNAEATFFTGRYRDGTWQWDDKPLGWSSAYVEGNAYHYLWYVPYDVDAMIEVQHGGDREAFFARYADYWQSVYDEPNDKIPDDYYWHGNEPVMHVAFLGSLAGRPGLTAEAARWVMANRYSTAPNGLDGNDDAGTLSAWYLWASIGMFPVAGTTTYALASPIFERVEIERSDDELVVLRAPGVSETVRYAASWKAGDTVLTGSTAQHDELFGGGDIVFELSDDPMAWTGDK